MKPNSFGAGLAALALGGGLTLVAGSPAAAQSGSSRPHTALSSGGAVQTVVSGLNSPRHLTVGPDGALYVATAGTGGTDCTTGTNDAGQPAPQCLGPTGQILRVTTSGTQSVALDGLPSVVTQATDSIPVPEYAGPSAVAYKGGKLEVVTQDVGVMSDGTNEFGVPGSNLGQFLTAAPGSTSDTWADTFNFAQYASANPQTEASLGTSPSETAYDSDPYAITPYGDDWAVVDAAANALRILDPAGNVLFSTSFPLSGTGTNVQAVPTSVVVGPDGALYVGELTGVDSSTHTQPTGAAVVYRVVPGQAPTVFASGFTAASDIAFDKAGRLIVLEYDTGGISDQNPVNKGEVIRIERDGTQTVLANSGLTQPTGLAVGDDGNVYVSNGGDGAATGSIVRIPVNGADGYRLTGADGGSFNLGSYSFSGSSAGQHAAPTVDGVSMDNGPGYWQADTVGDVSAFGSAALYGSPAGLKLTKPIVAMAPTPDGQGYWLVAADGGVFNYGDAGFFGSAGSYPLTKPIVGIAPTPDGQGYWMVASDGGVFTFGDANFYGSEGNVKLSEPVVGLASTPDGAGYWLVASDGGVFTHGDAVFHGSEGNVKLVKPVVGLQATSDGAGYWLVASDGGVFTLGDAGFYGSLGNVKLAAPIVSIG